MLRRRLEGVEVAQGGRMNMRMKVLRLDVLHHVAMDVKSRGPQYTNGMASFTSGIHE